MQICTTEDACVDNTLIAYLFGHSTSSDLNPTELVKVGVFRFFETISVTIQTHGLPYTGHNLNCNLLFFHYK